MSILLTYISPVDGGKRDKYHIIVQNNEEELDIRVKKLPLQQDVFSLTAIIQSKIQVILARMTRGLDIAKKKSKYLKYKLQGSNCLIFYINNFYFSSYAKLM